jgi:hypothetical protein
MTECCDCAKECAVKDKECRKFARKDYLEQHLRRVHKVKWRGEFERWRVREE